MCASCLRKQLLSSIVRSRSQLRLVACRRRRRRRRVVVIAIYSHALFALRRFVSSSCSAANFNSSPKVARLIVVVVFSILQGGCQLVSWVECVRVMCTRLAERCKMQSCQSEWVDSALKGPNKKIVCS